MWQNASHDSAEFRNCEREPPAGASRIDTEAQPLVELYRWLPPEAAKILLVLFLSFLIGLEREEHKFAAGSYSFGGVRTFPLIGLIGYTVALLSGAQLLPVTFGFMVVGAFLLLSYWHKLSRVETAGITTEMSGLTTYLVGALVCYDHLWIATALSVVSLLLLELKTALEKLASRAAPEEILTFAKFLLLSAVILPALPNHEFGHFHINPFKTWLVVVAVSTISYGSYVLQKVTKEKGGVVLTAFLGGAYSSTVTTVAMSRRAAREDRPHLFAGGILIASGMMYVRLGRSPDSFQPSTGNYGGARLSHPRWSGHCNRLVLVSQARRSGFTDKARV